MKLHLLCSTNRVPLSYELTPANVTDLSLSEELLAEAKLGEEVARKLLGDLAYRSEELEEELAESRGSCCLEQRGQRQTARGKATDRDLFFESQAHLRARGEAG